MRLPWFTDFVAHCLCYFQALSLTPRHPLAEERLSWTLVRLRPKRWCVSKSLLASRMPADKCFLFLQTREELEKEVESLRAANKELATLKALAAETTKLRTEVEKLTKTNKQLLNSKETAQSDFAYMQAQYSEASTAAVARAREATVAEDEAARLKMLLDTGLKQRDLISKGENRALKHELDRLKSEVHLLKAESRRTVDVRDKAAKWDYYLAKKEHEEEMAKGEVDGDETSSEEGGDDDDREEESADSQVVGDALVPIKNDEADTTMATETSFAPEPSTIDDSIVQPSSTSSSSNQPFVCEWRIGSAVEAQPCGAVVASRQVRPRSSYCFLAVSDFLFFTRRPSTSIYKATSLRRNRRTSQSTRRPMCLRQTFLPHQHQPSLLRYPRRPSSLHPRTPPSCTCSRSFLISPVSPRILPVVFCTSSCLPALY